MISLLLLIIIMITLSNSYLINNNNYYNNYKIKQQKYNILANKNKKLEEDNKKIESLPKIGIGALIQLVTMGAGAPSLGEFKRWEGSKAIFELEANNFADSEGNSLQTKKKYFLDGYVEEEGEKPPSFFSNLLSGGKKMEEWSERVEQSKKVNKKK